jgi:hypothetical protein
LGKLSERVIVVGFATLSLHWMKNAHEFAFACGDVHSGGFLNLCKFTFCCLDALLSEFNFRVWWWFYEFWTQLYHLFVCRTRIHRTN